MDTTTLRQRISEDETAAVELTEHVGGGRDEWFLRREMLRAEVMRDVLDVCESSPGPVAEQVRAALARQWA